MDTAENLPLQCDFRALHVRLVGALSLQYIGGGVDVVYLLQRSTLCV